jgi:hypothetical protein
VNVGGPLRGYNRAVRISALYCINCFVIGSVLFVLAAVLFMRSGDILEVAFMTVFFHLFFCAVLFLTSLPANLLLARWFRGRTWRNERWRARMAGGLGIIFSAVGIVLGFVAPPPAPVTALLGEFGSILNFVGWLILFSNLGLLVAWSLPSKKP